MRARLVLCVMAMLVLGGMAAGAATAADEPSTLRFAEPTAVTVLRSEGDYTLTVLRDGDLSQPASVTVSSSEGFEARVAIGAGGASGSLTVPLPEGAVAPGGFVTFTLSAPSPGSIIGQPESVTMFIDEDLPDATPPPPNRPPSATIERAGATVIAGRAADPEQAPLRRVELRVLKREGRTCRAVKASGRLGRRGSCSSAYALVATGTERWTFRPAHRLPAGRYVVAARAVDSGGLRDRTPASRTFMVR